MTSRFSGATPEPCRRGARGRLRVGPRVAVTTAGMIRQPFADVLDFILSHDGCASIAMDLATEDAYTLRCACGAAIERPIPGPDARYRIIFRSLAFLAEN